MTITKEQLQWYQNKVGYKIEVVSKEIADKILIKRLEYLNKQREELMDSYNYILDEIDNFEKYIQHTDELESIEQKEKRLYKESCEIIEYLEIEKGE